MGENCESQSNDPEVIALLEDPFASPIVVERALMDAEVCSLLDVLCETWIPSKSAVQNLKKILGLVQSYITNQRKVDPTTRRMREAKMFKDTLIRVLKLWFDKLHSLSPTCSQEEIVNFLRTNQNLYATFAKDVMTQDTYFEWIHDLKEHVKSQPLSSSSTATADVSTQCAMEQVSDCTEAKSHGGGLATLFDDLPMSHPQESDVFSQYISKLENGRLLTLRSPGERGYRLIRLDVYDCRDIVNVDKRQWWKHAKVRSQFLTYSSLDPKHQLTRHLLDRAADDLKEVEGIRKEMNDLAHHSG